MKCDATALSAFTDDELPPRRAARVRAHLESCAACRRALEELHALKAALAAEAGQGPEPARGFAELMQALHAQPSPPSRPRFLLPALAAAALAVVLGAAAYRHRRAPSLSDDQLISEAEHAFRAADTQYREAIDKLRLVADRARTDWPAPRRLEYDDAARALEVASEKCRSVAHARPADGEAEGLLFAAYQKQIRFLQDQLWRGGR